MNEKISDWKLLGITILFLIASMGIMVLDTILHNLHSQGGTIAEAIGTTHFIWMASLSLFNYGFFVRVTGSLILNFYPVSFAMLLGTSMGLGLVLVLNMAGPDPAETTLAVHCGFLGFYLACRLGFWRAERKRQAMKQLVKEVVEAQ